VALALAHLTVTLDAAAALALMQEKYLKLLQELSGQFAQAELRAVDQVVADAPVLDHIYVKALQLVCA
jgi:hypothetical protein